MHIGGHKHRPANVFGALFRKFSLAGPLARLLNFDIIAAKADQLRNLVKLDKSVGFGQNTGNSQGANTWNTPQTLDLGEQILSGAQLFSNEFGQLVNLAADGLNALAQGLFGLAGLAHRCGPAREADC